MLQDANGNEITVGSIVRHSQPTGYHDLGELSAKVTEIRGSVAILGGIQAKSAAYLGCLLVVQGAGR